MKVAEADFGGKLPDMNRNDIYLGEIAPSLSMEFARRTYKRWTETLEPCKASVYEH